VSGILGEEAPDRTDFSSDDLFTVASACFLSIIINSLRLSFFARISVHQRCIRGKVFLPCICATQL
jgi:hypothetical protein